MSKSRLEWRVGLFVFIGLGLLAVLLIQFSKGMTFFRPTYDIHMRTENVGGLKARASVLMAGVQVGTVNEIHLAPDGRSVTIILRIYKQFVIHKDAAFSIKQSGFLGDQYVSIRPGANEKEPFKDGETAMAISPFDMLEFVGSTSNLIGRLESTMARVEGVVSNVDNQLLNHTTLSNLSSSVLNLRQVTEQAQTTINKVNTLADTANSVTEKANYLVESNGPVISASLNNVQLFAQDLTNLLSNARPRVDSALQNIDQATAHLKDVMAKVHAGDGLAGKLLYDDKLANDVSQIATNLSITTSNLNKRGLWGILWKQKTPKSDENPAPRAKNLRSPKQITR